MRPADANEVVEAWRVIMQFRHEPVALILSRQALPVLDRTKYAPAAGVARGAYVLADAETAVPRCCCWPPAARSRCASRLMSNSRPRHQARVVSMPSWEVFEHHVANTRSIASKCCRRR